MASIPGRKKPTPNPRTAGTPRGKSIRAKKLTTPTKAPAKREVLPISELEPRQRGSNDSSTNT